ncbi:Putative peptidoglycan binding domain-containing protein [Nakamurella panacisegetis]|uniref:Putative peptidoglycan binding domain-containing protein n=1 Tax=Nakamurella panacisegetis TaxID=1090615 RepID=A0A1H0M5R8_9ACTN|nr:peptidoglycan-binding protein [Nakamurella panacisegetis]SDO75808.1 Putative peptidoglycan binding domain-containing protein [Nakamurella panacisegetis]
MSGPTEARSCPSCGAVVDSQYCPHCGARVVPMGGEPSAPSPVWTGATAVREPDLEAVTLPSIPVVRAADGPAAAVPEMFPTEMVPTSAPPAAQAWSQTPDPANPQTGLFPGWTGMYPAVATDGAGGGQGSRRERRRRALYGVLGIAAVTAVVLLAALLIAPHWSGTAADTADKNGQPTAVSSAPMSAAPSSSRSASGVQPTAATSVPVAPPASTVTVTASVTSTTATPTPSSPKTTHAPAKATTPKKTTPKKTPPAALPFGVPQKNIVCSPGYVVQLASELTAAAFTARVATLKAAGQVPAGSLAADSAKSCKIFTSQSNTLVLYSGPYAGKYDGCAARLAGPADAYIKGGNPATAQQYVSCLCPMVTGRLPQYGQVGQTGVWIGELQRVLGNRLNIDIPDLTGQWGTYTAGTRDAVRKFQQAAHLPPTGVVTGRTWESLRRASC